MATKPTATDTATTEANLEATPIAIPTEGTKVTINPVTTEVTSAIPLANHAYHHISDEYLAYLKSKALIAASSTDATVKDASRVDLTAAETIISYREANKITVK